MILFFNLFYLKVIDADHFIASDLQGIVQALGNANVSVINADGDGMTVTATMGGAAGTGTIVVRIFYAID